MSRRTQNPWTPETKTGVNYFKHQTKHFLTPYGKAHGLLTSREILDKLYHWNCEWLTRPNYAISELADTIYANLATLADYKDKVFTKHAVDPLLNKARPIRSVLQRFNKKDSSTSEEPDERDLRDLMKFVEDDTLKGLCKHLFAASGAMFSVATHIMTLETLFSHPTEYANATVSRQKCRDLSKILPANQWSLILRLKRSATLRQWQTMNPLEASGTPSLNEAPADKNARLLRFGT